TSTIVFEHGDVNEYVGGYQDWLRQRQPEPVAQEQKPVPKAAPAPVAQDTSKKKRSYKEQRELEQLPRLIEQLEQDISALQATLSAPALYQRDPQAFRAATDSLAEKEAELESAFERWQALE